MTVVTPLYGHTSFETAYLVSDYPYGGLRCKMYFWLESHPKKGTRFVSRSENPKNGRMNKPHAGTYHKVTGNLYLDEKGHCKAAMVNEYTDAKDVLEFIKNFPENHLLKTDLFMWCKMKHRYLSRCVETKSSGFRINGEASEASEHQVALWTVERDLWAECVRLTTNNNG